MVCQQQPWIASTSAKTTTPACSWPTSVATKTFVTSCASGILHPARKCFLTRWSTLFVTWPQRRQTIWVCRLSWTIHGCRPTRTVSAPLCTRKWCPILYLVADQSSWRRTVPPKAYAPLQETIVLWTILPTCSRGLSTDRIGKTWSPPWPLTMSATRWVQNAEFSW
jgi:hypothetical protein